MRPHENQSEWRVPLEHGEIDGLPAMDRSSSASTAKSDGTQERNASIPFARAEQSRATRSCSTAPSKSEHGAINTRVAAVMVRMLGSAL